MRPGVKVEEAAGLAVVEVEEEQVFAADRGVAVVQD